MDTQQYLKRSNQLSPTLRDNRIEGYAIVFYNQRDKGTEAQIGPNVYERITPQAVEKALARGNDIVSKYNHKGAVLARTASGTLELEVTNKGLRYSYRIDPNDPDHATIKTRLQRGDILGSSFSFYPVSQEYRNEGGRRITVVNDMVVSEVGPVDSPAYSSAEASVRCYRGLEGWLEEQERLHEETIKRLENIASTLHR